MIYHDCALRNEDGSEAVENGKPATALLGIKRALLMDGDKRLSADQKLRRYELFSKLADSWNDVELTVDEVALAKEAAEIYPTLVYGQLVHFLNQKTHDRHEKNRHVSR